MSSSMGVLKLAERLDDPSTQEWYDGIFPKDTQARAHHGGRSGAAPLSGRAAPTSSSSSLHGVRCSLTSKLIMKQTSRSGAAEQ